MNFVQYLLQMKKSCYCSLLSKCLPDCKKLTLFKEAVSRDFLAFFSFIEPIWVPDKQCEMVSLKNSFSQRYSRKTLLCAVWYCAESDSAQYHTAPSREIEMSENCAKSDSAQCEIIFILFLKTSISLTFRIYMMIFRKKFENISKSKSA